VADKKKKKKTTHPATQFPPEDRRAESVTIAWMLCTLFTFCAEAVGLIAQIALPYAGGDDTSRAAWTLLPQITLVMSLVTGILCLVLIPLVYRLRITRPPDAITFVAVLIGLAPLATLVIRWLQGS
jgi:hypothetical protein